MALDDTHRQYLLDHAITPETLETTGVYSEGEEIVFPWRDGETVTLQRRPWPGNSGQYFWEKGKDLHFWDLRDAGPGSPVLVIEGTKQSLAAVSHAGPSWSVMGMAGCEGWGRCDLSRFEGRDVYIGLDADAGENLSVWEAGDLFRQELEFYQVRTVRFLHLPARGTQGLDDVLAKRPEAKRAALLEHLAQRSQSKPAERKPTVRKGVKLETILPDTGGRPGVAVNLDRLDVVNQITGHLLEAHDGKTLFNFGGAITKVVGHETRPFDRDSFNAALVETMACFHYVEASGNKPAVFTPTWPDPQTVGAVMSRAERFSSLRRVVRVPFLRPDGTVCYTQGYDRETATVLVSEGLDDVAVPDEPTQEETRAAAKFLMEEWLGDLPFKGDADRANALAMVLTPFLRGVVPLSPLGIVSGLQMGVGKNLLADCISLLATGSPADPLPYVQDDDEMRKMITSAFQSGAEMFIFDEAHEIQGAQLARAITSLTYADRILGATRIAKYPNSITWMSLGNQVKVNGDLSRRVFFVCLHPTGRNVHDREASAFRHPDLKAWTAANRPALVAAALTVLRGWYAAGSPAHSRGATMGSFEPWDRILSGVLAYAGHPAFLTDLRERRSETDYSTSYWNAHVAWLRQTFGADPFTAAKVQRTALQNPGRCELPPGLENPAADGWTRALGRAYGSRQDRDHEGLRLIKVGTGHGSTVKWGIVTDTDNEGGIGTSDGGDGGSGGSTPSLRVGKTPPSLESPARAGTRAGDVGSREPSTPSITSTGGTVGFDLETADAGALYHGGHDGPFIRLAGVVHGDGPVDTVTESVDHYPPAPFRATVNALNEAETVYGHNVLGFDLPALARHADADLDALADKTVDTLVLARLADPPGAKGMKPWSADSYYGLDSVAKRLGHQGKSDDLRALALEFCPEGETDAAGRKLTEKERASLGYSRIPVDDPRYRDYLSGDLDATRFVYNRLTADGISEYARREMRVEWLKNRMTFNGWKIDTDLLAERVDAEAARVAEAKRLLSERGMPLHKPDRYKLRLKKDWPTERAGESAAAMRAVMTEDGPAAVAMGIADRIPGEPYASPWSTVPGRAAIVRALQSAGAEFYPRTGEGELKLSSDALGSDWWVDHTGKRRPGMLRAYADHPNFQEIRSICEAVTLATGATAKYAEIQRWTTADGRVHAENSAPQASGRHATKHPAQTNLGARGEAREQRAVYVADDGHRLLTVDLSQVDMRAMAALSQDPAYMALFAPGRDAHMDMAEAYFGERTPEARQKTKAFNHGGNYGQGPAAVSESSGLPLELCYELARIKAEAFPDLMTYIQSVRDLASTGSLLDNGFGRLMRPDPERAYTQAPALMGQGAARDIMWESVLRLVDADSRVTPYLRGIVHDELVVSVPEDETEYWADRLRDAFTWEWLGVPILCEVSNPGLRWTECEH